MTDNNELTILELNDVKYRLGKSIYAELDMSLERFVELLGRDLYCPTLSQAPTSSTVSYKDTDDTVNTFQAGQPCRWQEGNAWRLAVCTNNIGTSATWYVLPTKVSELTNDAGYLTQHQDITGKLDKTEASETYLTQTDASNTYLGKGAKAASAVIADSATNATSATTATNLASAPSLVADGDDIKVTAGGKTSNGFTVPFATSAGSCTGNADTATKATQDGSGNVIVDTYATKSEVSKGLLDKVDKDGTKVLSSNDFTDKLKEKLEGLNNYNDTAINNAISGLQSQLNTLVSGDASTAIESFNEIIAFLDGIKEDEDLASIISSIEQQIAGKQDTIDNLDAIKSGAQAGSTAVQPGDLHEVATSGSYTDLTNKPTIPDALADLSADETHRTVTDSEKEAWNSKSNFSGSYTDLTNKPNIPDISGKLDKTEASDTYLTKADASQTYLGKNDKAASAATADSVNWDNVDGRPTKLSELEDDVVVGNYLPLSGGTLTGEIKFNIADLTYKDISAGIIAAFKAFRVQINELISNYIYLGSDSQGNSSDSSLVIRKYSSITDKSPSGTTDLVTIDTSGNVTAIGGFTGNLTGTATQADNTNRLETGFTKGVRLGNEGAINEGWVRIAKGIHGYQSQFIVSLKKTASNSNDENYTLAVNCKYAGAFINQLSGGYGGANNTIKKVRVECVDTGTYYFDFYVSDTTRFNDYSWVVYGSANTLDATFNPEVTGTIVEFETSNGVKSNNGFTGDLNGTATSATQDGNGNVIADTYATKGEVNEKVNGNGISNIVKVTSLPESPDENTLYIVVEE